jgi:uncharacterized damage-inducible protein DinB
MKEAGISFRELLDYTDDETNRWQVFFRAHPEAFEVVSDVRGTKNVRELVLHIFQAELIFGNAVLGEPRPDLTKLPQATLDQIFAIGESARKKLREFVAVASEEALAEQSPFGPAGNVSRRKLLAQALTHGMRHWAQLATDLRRAGYPTDWVHDIVMSPAVK